MAFYASASQAASGPATFIRRAFDGCGGFVVTFAAAVRVARAVESRRIVDRNDLRILGMDGHNLPL